MTTVPELRAIVRTQTQTDASDLPDSTIDTYLQQGYERTINAETEWPFFAKSWDVTLTAGEASVALPGDVSEPGIRALVDKSTHYRLDMVPQEWAEDAFRGNNVGTMGPMMFSVWGGSLALWPAIGLSADRAYTLRGYRVPLSWIDATTNSPDCDPRLHLAFTHYAVALAYAQQEDEVLEQVYMARWQADAEIARQQIMRPVYHRPLVGAGSIGSPIYHSATRWVVSPP